MNKILRNIGIGVAVIIVILLVLPMFINVNSFRPRIESELSSALGRKAEVGDLSLSILGGSVSAANISIADDPAFSNSPFLTAKSLKIGVELLPLIFSKKLNVTGITLDEPSIVLLSAPNGTWNFSSLGGTGAKEIPKPGGAASKEAPKPGGAAAGQFSVAELKVSDGKLQIGKVRSTAKPMVIDKVNIVVKNFSASSQFPFTLSASLPGGGGLKLEGKAGPMDVPEGIPLDATVKVDKLDLAAFDPTMGIAGLGSLDGGLTSDGKTAKASGTATLEKMKLAAKGAPAGRPVQAKFATDYDLKKQAGTISQGDISVGKAIARLSGRYQSQGEAMVLNMKLDGPGMPVDELEALLPALGVTLPSGTSLKGGTLSTAMSITGPADKLVIAGPVRLENTKLEGFDLGAKLGALAAFTGKAPSSRDTSIQNASTDARVAPEGTKLDAIDVIVPSLGEVTGAGTISPDGALNFRMLANLSGGAAGGLTQIVGRGGKGGGGIPFMIEGTTSNPKFVPDVKGLAAGAAEQAISGKLPKAESATKGLGGLLKKKP
jgi:AsmA protein